VRPYEIHYKNTASRNNFSAADGACRITIHWGLAASKISAQTSQCVRRVEPQRIEKAWSKHHSCHELNSRSIGGIMAQQQQQNVALVSYISRELLVRVQLAARQSNRSVAGQVRDLLMRTYGAQPKIELR
jgi:hypothetical protein